VPEQVPPQPKIDKKINQIPEARSYGASGCLLAIRSWVMGFRLMHLSMSNARQKASVSSMLGSGPSMAQAMDGPAGTSPGRLEGDRAPTG